MDLNTSLTQALSDGTNTYIYGNGRIAQISGSTTEYFFGDALGSVRQIANQSGVVTYAHAYDPYGVVTTTSGSSYTPFGYTSEYTDVNGVMYLRSRYYAPSIGRFLNRDTWTGIYINPITLNKWAYAHDNPVMLTDPSGQDPITLILILIGIILGTSGCRAGPEPDVCPALPENLQPDALSKNPREQSLQNIKDYFGIQLPPAVTYVDISHISHSTSYEFAYSSVEAGHAGYTPWFTNRFEGRWGSQWGDIMIFETTFTYSNYNAYDIASVMVHEAAHAWQQYTLWQLAQDSQSPFMEYLENHSYYTYEWQDDYYNVLEYEASSYVLQHTPTPLCTSPTVRDNETEYRTNHSNLTPVVGLEQSPWPMSGYPLP
jgi:RHS repeat-associated protein